MNLTKYAVIILLSTLTSAFTAWGATAMTDWVALKGWVKAIEQWHRDSIKDPTIPKPEFAWSFRVAWPRWATAFASGAGAGFLAGWQAVQSGIVGGE